MAKLKNTGMIRVGNAVLKERNPACFSCKNAHCFLLAEKCFLISKKIIRQMFQNTRHLF